MFRVSGPQILIIASQHSGIHGGLVMRKFSLISKPFLAALLLLSQLTVQHAQWPDFQKERAQEENQLKVVEHDPLILIDAGVISATTGSPVTNLGHEDFIISENNVQQLVAFWRRIHLPLSLQIVVDVNANYSDRLGLESQVNALKTSLALFLRPEDEVSIMVLTEGPLLLQENTNNKDLINSALDRALQSIETQHLSAGKRFRAAIFEAAKRAGSPRRLERRRATILISDLPEKTANETVLPEWVVRTVLDSATIFCWSRSTHPAARVFDANKVSFKRVTITAMIDLTGGDSVGSDWKSLLERLRARYQIAYLPRTLGRSGDAVRITLELKTTARRDTRALVLTYPRFAIIPFSKR
jgi:hypothetical protein